MDTASLASLIHPSTSSSVAFSSKYARYRPLTRGRDVIVTPSGISRGFACKISNRRSPSTTFRSRIRSHSATPSGYHVPSSIAVQNSSKSSAASGASASLKRCHRSLLRSANRPPNAFSTWSASPTLPANDTKSAGGAPPSAHAAFRTGSIARFRSLRSTCCDGRCSSSAQSGDVSAFPTSACSFSLGVGCELGRRARVGGGSIVFFAAKSARPPAASCVSVPTPGTLARSIVPGAVSVAAAPARYPSVNSVTKSSPADSGTTSGSSSSSCESGTSSDAAAASSSSSFPLLCVYGSSGSLVHFLRQSSSHACETTRCMPVWFAFAHFAPSNS